MMFLFIVKFAQKRQKKKGQQNEYDYKKIMKQMFISKLIVCTLLSWTIYAMTDITLLNCPSQFNITSANETVGGLSGWGQFLYSSFQNPTHITRVQNIVITGDTDDLQSYIFQLVTPYIIIAVIMLLMFVLVIFYCLFDRNWPPCESLRRNPLEQPYTSRERNCMICWIVLFGFCVLGLSVGTLVVIPSMKNYIDYTKCSIYSTLDNTINGDEDNGWGGFQQLKYKIGNISSLLDSTVTQVNTYFTNDEWLVDDMMVMKKKNIEIYTQNQNATIITPNPDTTQTNLDAGFDFPRVDSVFVRTGMGPNGTFNTMVDDIDRGLRTTEKKSYQAYQIYQSAQTLVESSATIQANSVAAQNTLSMYLQQLSVLNTQLDTFSQQYFSNYFSYGLYLQQTVIGFLLTGSIILLVGALSTHCCQIFVCRYMVHCGWCFYGWMYVGVLALSFITLSMGAVSYNFCLYFEGMLKDPSEYGRISDAYSQNAFNRLDVCLFEDGDALRKFDISDEMRTVTNLFTDISTYYDYDNPSSTNYVDLSISAAKLTGWISAIEKYKDGVYVDSNPVETTNDNPNQAIQQLNLYSYTGGGVSTCSKDRWVFDSENCTDPSEVIYQATADESNGMAISTTDVICISFNEKFTTSMGSSWTQSHFTKRYVQIRQDCPDAYEKIIQFGQTLINFRDSRIDLFQGIEDSLTEIYTLNTNFNNVMAAYRTRVDQFYGSVATLNDIVANQIDGLLVTSDCRTLGDSVRFVYNSFCINFMSQIAVVGVCSLLLLVTICGGLLVGSIFGVRYANIQKLSRIKAEHEHLEETSSQRKINFDNVFISSERSEQSESSEGENKKN